MPATRSRPIATHSPAVPLHPLTLAVRGAFVAIVGSAALALPMAVHAAEPAAQSAQKAYQINAGPLGPALMDFAGQAGINLSMDLAQLKDLRTPGLSGPHTVDSGLARLLEHSGLHARRLGAGNYALEAAPATQTPAAPAASKTGAAASADGQAAAELAAVTVSARTQNNLVAPSRQVTILEGEEVQQLRQGSDSLATMLSKVVPGMADSSHTITDYGQTLRGRNMLVLVDGVPLNTNRDSSRNLSLIHI